MIELASAVNLQYRGYTMEHDAKEQIAQEKYGKVRWYNGTQ